LACVARYAYDVTTALIRELLQNPTEENCRLIAEALRATPKEDKNKLLPIRLAEANERMARGECLELDEVRDLFDKLGRWGL
jgi:hypothetical protein